MRVRADAEVAPIIGACALGIGTLMSALILFWGGWVATIPLLFFGTFTVFFVLESIPGWVEVNAAGLSYRHRRRVRRVAWDEIERVEENRLLAELPPQLELYLSSPGRARFGASLLRVPAIEPAAQAKMLELVREHLAEAPSPRRVERRTPAASSVQVSVTRPSGALRVVVRGNTDGLLQALQDSALSAVLECQYDPTFSGEVELVVASDETPDLRLALASVARDVQREASSKVRMANGDVRVSARFEGDSTSVKAEKLAPPRDRRLPKMRMRETDHVIEFARVWLDLQLELIQGAEAGPLVPVAIVPDTAPDGGAMHSHFLAPKYSDGVNMALDHVERTRGDWIVIWDGYLTQHGTRTDALFAIARVGTDERRFARRYRRVNPERVKWSGDIVPLSDDSGET
jgi:hypothetical protein